jgi:hypothetical protein
MFGRPPEEIVLQQERSSLLDSPFFKDKPKESSMDAS